MVLNPADTPDYKRLRPLFRFAADKSIHEGLGLVGFSLPSGTTVRYRFQLRPCSCATPGFDPGVASPKVTKAGAHNIAFFRAVSNSWFGYHVDFTARAAGNTPENLGQIANGEDDVHPSIANGEYWHRLKIAGLPPDFQLYITIPNYEDREFDELTPTQAEELAPFKMVLIDYLRREVWEGDCDKVNEARATIKALLPDLRQGLCVTEIIENFWYLDAAAQLYEQRNPPFNPLGNL